MDYEIVTLEEKTVAGISARTNNSAPDMGAVLGSLWDRFYHGGIYASIPEKANGTVLGIYTGYAGDETGDYTAMAACETASEPSGKDFAVCKVPAGRYAKFTVHSNEAQAVAAAWAEIWRMNLPRAFQCDFEEYPDSGTEHTLVHIYVGLKGCQDGIESRCGLLCHECTYREQMGCAGCANMEKPFWGDCCPVKDCCEGKRLAHCGQCGQFPCALLNRFAYDEKQGDNGKRITQCRHWEGQ